MDTQQQLQATQIKQPATLKAAQTSPAPAHQPGNARLIRKCQLKQIKHEFDDFSAGFPSEQPTYMHFKTYSARFYTTNSTHNEQVCCYSPVRTPESLVHHEILHNVLQVKLFCSLIFKKYNQSTHTVCDTTIDCINSQSHNSDSKSCSVTSMDVLIE